MPLYNDEATRLLGGSGDIQLGFLSRLRWSELPPELNQYSFAPTTGDRWKSAVGLDVFPDEH
jgi:hypothetical protein